MTTVSKSILTVLVSLSILAGTLAFGALPALAAGPETLAAEAVTGMSAKLNGVLNPHAAGEAGTYQFVYRRSPTECQGAEEKATEEHTAAGHSPERVPAEEVTGLLAHTQYTFCLRAVNGAGEAAVGNPVTFTTLVVKPEVSREVVSNVGSTSARLTGEVNPGGSATTYYFEYGTSNAYGSRTSVTSVGAGSEAVKVVATLSGLEPGTLYYFRLVATNAGDELGEGAEQTFSTFPEGVPGLPDGRSYEAVSPLSRGYAEGDVNVYLPFNEVTSASSTLPFRAAPDGSALTYVASAPAQGGNNHIKVGASHEGNQYLARARPGGGWSSALIQPSGAEAYYQAFSPDLSVGILGSTTVLSAGVPGGGRALLYAHDTAGGSYEPFFTTTPHRQAEEFGSFRVPDSGENLLTLNTGLHSQLVFAGASANMSHRLFAADDALLPGAGPLETELREDEQREAQEARSLPLEAEKLSEEAVKLRGEERYSEAEQKESEAAQKLKEAESLPHNYLYDSVAGAMDLVDVLPDGKVDPNATFGGSPPSEPTEVSTHNMPDYSHTISADGSRIFWTDAHDHDLYVRENDTQPQSPLGPNNECTVAADACTVLIAKAAQFWAASDDGARVFFTDCNKLTTDSTAVPHENCKPILTEQLQSVEVNGGPNEVEGEDLYEYNLKSGTITDLTVDNNHSDPLRANVQGVLGEGEEGGSYTIYFAAGGALAPDASTQECREGGSCNLYALHEGEPPRFVESLAQNDDRISRGTDDIVGDWTPGLGVRTAQATPDGRHLIYKTNDGPIFLYDYGSTGPLCISCSPTGVPSEAQFPVSLSVTYAPRLISSDGDRVFFETGQALVPQDENGVADVYEWERNASGSCALQHGCLYLLSGGTGSAEARFVEASESGDDVFIATSNHLVTADESETVQIFDARVDAPVPTAAPACSGTGCQGLPGSPPTFATPSSVTFAGVGNFSSSSPAVVKPKALTNAQKLAAALKACKRKPKKQRAGCEKQARKRYAAKPKKKQRAKKATTNRRASR